MDERPRDPWDRPVAWPGDGAATPAASLPVDSPWGDAPAGTLPPKRVVPAGTPLSEPAADAAGADPWTVHAPVAWGQTDPETPSETVAAPAPAHEPSAWTPAPASVAPPLEPASFPEPVSGVWTPATAAAPPPPPPPPPQATPAAASAPPSAPVPEPSIAASAAPTAAHQDPWTTPTNTEPQDPWGDPSPESADTWSPTPSTAPAQDPWGEASPASADAWSTAPSATPASQPADAWTSSPTDSWTPAPTPAPPHEPTPPTDAWTPGTEDPWAPAPTPPAPPAAPTGSLPPPPPPPPPPTLAPSNPAAPVGNDLVAVDTSDPATGWDRADLLPTALTVPILPAHLQDLKAKAQEALIERMGSRLYDRSLTEDQIENYVVTELGGFLFEEDVRLADHEREQLTAELLNDVLRHGPIEPFLDDETVSEIMVNGLNSIYVERSGKLERTQSNFLTEAHLRQIIERIVSKVGRRIDESSPMVDARLPDGSRVNAVIPPLAVDGPSLTIRKFSRDALTVDDLVHFGTLSPISVEFLTCAVRGRLNVLVSGGTGTGKTTMLNVLSSFIPEEERIVTLEDAVELQLKQQHLVRLESRPANVEGKGQVSIRDLVRNSLRMRPDRVIIGECRGGEAMDMLQAMNTGHDGSLSTLHANGPRDAVARLETLCLMAGMDLPVKAIREQIASAVDLIVHVARLRDGTRRVTHISEIVGLDGEALMMTDIFTFDFDAGIGSDGRYAGLLCPTGQVPVVLSKLREHGEDVSPDLFLPEDEFAESDH